MSVWPGDWSCPGCTDLQFAKNTSCRRCGTPRPMGGADPSAQAPAAYQPGAYVASGGGGGAGGVDAMRPGDWMCPGCGDHQFAKNHVCRRCSTPRPNGAAAAGVPGSNGNGYAAPQAWSAVQDFGAAGMAQPGDYMASGCGSAMSGLPPGGAKPGDWICSGCGDLQFARNPACRRCGAAPPTSSAAAMSMAYAASGQTAYIGPPSYAAAAAGAGGYAGPPSALAAQGTADTMRPGDWVCPNCSDHVFARNDACRRCNTPRAGGAAAATQDFRPGPMVPGGPKPGDWYCPSCQDLQFARNSACRRCGTMRPAEEYGRGQSRSPRR